MLVNETTGDNDFTVTITPKNYTASSFTTELQTELNSEGAYGDYVCSYDTQTYKITISSASGDFTISSGSSLNKVLRLSQTVDTSSSSGSLISNVVNINSPDNILLVSPSLRSNSIHYVPDESINVLSVLNIDRNPGSLFVYENNGTDNFLTANTNLSYIQLSLINGEDNSLIDLNGAGFIVEIECVKADALL